MSRRNYSKIANQIRRRVLELTHRTQSPHIGSSFSIVEILVALYFKILKLNARNPLDPSRDRFILSKGHACPALYAVLEERGLLRAGMLKKFGVNDGLLQHHPDKAERWGIEFSSGSLGHGLSVGAGMALAGSVKGLKYRVFVLLGDGELNEGLVWEAALFAGHHKLHRLVALVDQNHMQALGRSQEVLDMEPLDKKWSSFGWHVQKIDGHDINGMIKAFSRLSTSRPNVILFQTVKGKGVSFMENNLLWHYRYPHKDEYIAALKELQG